MLEKKDFQEIMESIEKLPEFNQKALKWTMHNWSLVESLCEQETSISKEELEKRIQEAVNTQDVVYYALLMYLKAVSECEKMENEKQI